MLIEFSILNVSKFTTEFKKAQDNIATLKKAPITRFPNRSIMNQIMITKYLI